MQSFSNANYKSYEYIKATNIYRGMVEVYNIVIKILSLIDKKLTKRAKIGYFIICQ